MSALLARELAPPYYAVASHKGRCRAARLRPQPTPAAIARRWLRASGARDALPVLTAYPTSLTAEVHFRRTDAYWLVLCHREGQLLRAVETPFLAAGACLYAAQSGPRNWDRLTVSPHPKRFARPSSSPAPSGREASTVGEAAERSDLPLIRMGRRRESPWVQVYNELIDLYQPHIGGFAGVGYWTYLRRFVNHDPENGWRGRAFPNKRHDGQVGADRLKDLERLHRLGSARREGGAPAALRRGPARWRDPALPVSGERSADR